MATKWPNRESWLTRERCSPFLSAEIMLKRPKLISPAAKTIPAITSGSTARSHKPARISSVPERPSPVRETFVALDRTSVRPRYSLVLVFAQLNPSRNLEKINGGPRQPYFRLPNDDQSRDFPL